MTVSYEKITPPTTGSTITFSDGKPLVPDDPIIPFIRGDGTGVDIWPATEKVIDAAIATAYAGQRKIHWFKVYAGDEACEIYGTYQYLPQDTLTAIKEYGIAIKGPLTTPIGGGIRSLNVALRQIFDLYACVRPCRYYAGTPSPHKTPEKLDVIVYRENTEDIYLGIEWKQGTEIADKLINYLNTELIPATPEHGKKQIPLDAGIGIKPISKTGSQRLVRRAIERGLLVNDLAVESINCEFATPAEISQAIENCDGFIIGSPTLAGHAPTQIQTALGIVLSTAAKTKLAGVFGSYGWSGEAVDLIETKLKDANYRLGFESLRVRFSPTESSLQAGYLAGETFARALKKTKKLRVPQQGMTETQIDRTAQAVGRIVGSLSVLTTRQGEDHAGFLVAKGDIPKVTRFFYFLHAEIKFHEIIEIEMSGIIAKIFID